MFRLFHLFRSVLCFLLLKAIHFSSYNLNPSNLDFYLQSQLVSQWLPALELSIYLFNINRYSSLGGWWSYLYLNLCHEPSSVLYMLGTKVIIIEIAENELQKNWNSTSLNSETLTWFSFERLSKVYCARLGPMFPRHPGPLLSVSQILT